MVCVPVFVERNQRYKNHLCCGKVVPPLHSFKFFCLVICCFVNFTSDLWTYWIFSFINFMVLRCLYQSARFSGSWEHIFSLAPFEGKCVFSVSHKFLVLLNIVLAFHYCNKISKIVLLKRRKDRAGYIYILRTVCGRVLKKWMPWFWDLGVYGRVREPGAGESSALMF